MASRRPQAGASHRLFVTVCPLDLWWMLPSVWVFALKHEERVQKAFSVDHHGPGDARLSHSAKPSLPDRMRLCEQHHEPGCISRKSLNGVASLALTITNPPHRKADRPRVALTGLQHVQAHGT